MIMLFAPHNTPDKYVMTLKCYLISFILLGGFATKFLITIIKINYMRPDSSVLAEGLQVRKYRAGIRLSGA